MKIHLKLKQKGIFIVFGLVLLVFFLNLHNLYRHWLVSGGYSVAGQMGSSDLMQVVLPQLNTTVLQPQINLEERQFAVIVVLSGTKHSNRRNSIRSTWGGWARSLNISVYFIVGVPEMENKTVLHNLLKEQSENNDLIVEQYNEGYYKLTGKVLRIFKWFTSTYGDLSRPYFLVKTDEDVFINLPNLVQELRKTTYFQYLRESAEPKRLNTNNSETYFLGGHKIPNTSLDHNPFSKWFIDEAEARKMSWPEYYPTYVTGPCYVMSGNLVQHLYEESLAVSNYPFEDVFITGIVGTLRLGLNIDRIRGFWLDRWKYKSELRDPAKRELLVAMHSVDYSEDMISLCQSLSTCAINTTYPVSKERRWWFF